MTYCCIGERSEKPFMIKDTQTGIYSMEELLYYIRENVFMLDQSDFGFSLSDFIRQRLKLPEIGAHYKKMLEHEESFADRVCMLFSETGFAGESEIETLRKALTLSEHMSNNDSHRVRGDFFYKCGRLPEAVLEYNTALKLIDGEQNPGDCAKLLILMGNAAARSFKFENARNYFEEAYRLTPGDPELLNKLIAASALEKPKEAFLKYMEEKNIPESIFVPVLDRLEAAASRSGRQGEARILKDAYNARKNGNYTEFMSLRRRVINEWKSRYRNSGV